MLKPQYHLLEYSGLLCGRTSKRITTLAVWLMYTLYFEGLRSFKVIDVDNRKSTLPMLVRMNRTFVLILNRFHVRRATSCKIKTFKGYLSATLSFEENPLTQRHHFFTKKLEFLWQPTMMISMILACSVLIRLKDVTQGQRDGQTPRL